MAIKKRNPKPVRKKKRPAAKAAVAEVVVEKADDEPEPESESDSSATSPEDEEILRVARERFARAEEAEAKSRAEALEDINFSVGEQWPEDQRAKREAEGRPCLTINRMPQFIRQVTNEQKQNRPQVKLSPEDNKASIETAKVFQGIIRNIERQSSADIAYDTAFDSAVRSGVGYWRLRIDYISHHSFDQQILIDRIRNRFSVFLDPYRQQPDGSDANWGFIFDDLAEDEFKAQYPEAKLSGFNDWGSVTGFDGWVSEKTVRVAEYYFREMVKKTICLLASGEVKEESEVVDGDVVREKREAMKPVVHHLKINGFEILERSVWPGSWVPIIEVVGEEIDLDGKRITEGVIRHAKDSQRMYNFSKSSEVETIMLAPRAPYVGYAGQFADHPEWETANTKAHAYLEVEPVSMNGTIAPLPQRNQYEPAIVAISASARMHAEDMKATTGIYDGALGAQGNETSGRAINARKMQAQTSNFHYFDSLAKAKRYSTTQIMELIPLIYTRAEVIKIVGEDGMETEVWINQEFTERGERKMHDLSVGRYGVAVSVGPGFETKRQEASAALLDFMKTSPQQAAVVADLWVRSLDFPGNTELADRLKKMLPPGIGDDKEAPQIPPQLQQQMQFLANQNQQLASELNRAMDERDKKLIEIQSREKIEQMKIQRDLELKAIELQYQGSELLLLQRLKEIEARIARTDAIQQHVTAEALAPDQQAAQVQPQIQPEEQMPPGGLPPAQPPNGVSP